MPNFDYQCTDCSKRYDVFHKSREIKEDVLCPSCGSKKHKRLISAPSISMGSNTKSSYQQSSDNCSTCCNSDTCGNN